MCDRYCNQFRIKLIIQLITHTQRCLFLSWAQIQVAHINLNSKIVVTSSIIPLRILQRSSFAIPLSKIVIVVNIVKSSSCFTAIRPKQDLCCALTRWWRSRAARRYTGITSLFIEAFSQNFIQVGLPQSHSPDLEQ